MKAQPVPQCQSPDQPILVDLMSLGHLRLGHPARIDAVERIEDEIGVIARRPEEGDDRVEQPNSGRHGESGLYGRFTAGFAGFKGRVFQMATCRHSSIA